MPGEPLHPHDHDPLIALEDREVPAKDREQILRQIETALERRRSVVTPQALVVRARKRGLLLPLLVNVLAVALVAGGVLVLLWYFRVRQEGIALEAGTYVSAEGRLLQVLREETDQRLAAKDVEIAVIQARLRELGAQGVALQSRADQELRGREQALRAEMEGRLAAERERLAALGTPAAGIDRRLQELQRQEQRALGSEIDSYRRQLEDELARQEAALREAREQARAALDRAGRDRSVLLEESSRREVEIRGQFDQERQALRSEAQGAADRAEAAEQALRRLSGQTETQRLLEDQITQLYLRTLAALQIGAAEEALAGLDAVEALLQSEAAAALPGTRRELDGLLLAALRELAVGAGQSRPAGGEGARQADLSAEPAREGSELTRVQGELTRVQGDLMRARSEVADRDRQIQALEGRLRAQAAAEQRATQRAAQLVAQLDGARSAQAAAEQSSRTARDDGLAAGREAALKDVMRYLSYVSGSAEERKALEGSLLALVRQDPLYRAVTREIQLSAPGGAGGQRGSYVFLGVVSSVSGPTVVVDPMIERSVSAGALVQLRRSSELDREQTIGTGKVLQVRGGKVTVLVDGGGSAPAVRDMVYLESRP